MELNSSFSNVIENLKILKFSETNPLAEGIANAILKSVLKMVNTQVLLQLETYTSGLTLSFLLSSLTRFLKQIKKLNPRKAAERTDIPVKILKDNADKFADYICEFLMNL